MNKSHPIHSKDADRCCRWLCESAGQRTKSDEDELAKALQNLPYQAQPIRFVGDPNILSRVR